MLFFLLALLAGIAAAPIGANVAAVPIGANVDVGAFVYDCWTTDDVAWGQHGANWSEWNLVKAATPRFEGHLQPKVPVWGYLDTALPASWDILTPAAVEHGVTVFLWDFYWFVNMTSPMLARGLNEGFLKSDTRNQAKWAIMWANQDWEDIHPAKRDAPRFTEYYGAIDGPTFKVMTDYWIANYLQLPNYYRVPDLNTSSPDRVCALVNIYMIDTLVTGLGGLDQTASAVADFRARAAAAGVPCIHIQAEGVSLHNVGRKSVSDVIAALGINSVTDYCWQHYVEMKGFPLTDYPSYASQAISAYGDREKAFKPAAYVPNFSIAWDPSPRTVQSDVWDAAALSSSGYPFSPVLQPTVAEIATALQTAAEALTSKCSPAWCMLTTYAYTEFSEGGSLFPTVQDGYGRLQAFQAVFGNRSTGGNSTGSF